MISALCSDNTEIFFCEFTNFAWLGNLAFHPMEEKKLKYLRTNCWSEHMGPEEKLTGAMNTLNNNLLHDL